MQDGMQDDSIEGGFLAGVSNLVGLPVDKVRFAVLRLVRIAEVNPVCSDSRTAGLSPKLRYIFLLILSFPLAYFLRAVLHPLRVGSTTRYLFNVFVGILFAVFCFGMYVP